MKKWDADLIREKFGIVNCRSVLMLEKEVRRKGRSVFTTRYYVSSLSSEVVSAQQFQQYILQHWEVENCLHLIKDKEYGEDKHVFRNAALGEVWTLLTSMAESVVQLTRKKERTLREIREQFHAKPKNALFP